MVGGWWLVVSGWWLVVSGWWLVVGGYWLAEWVDELLILWINRLDRLRVSWWMNG